VGASHTLAGSLARDGALPLLDEQAGTLEVREAASVFNQMASRLREQFKGRELMFAAISHDLRTPLTRLRMRLEAMDADAALQQRSIADVREMDALIDSVLTVFRGSGGAGTEPAFDIDVAALAQSLADDRQEQGQAVALGPLSAPAVARAQPAALRRIVDNLVDNALRYAGSATLSVLQGPGCVELRVEDEGPGIPPEALEAVCQPFFRLEGSRNRHTGGTGLGLYIARELAERQGGSLRLRNREGSKGLQASVRLPSAA
jgi:signal transduction histidine kinase